MTVEEIKDRIRPFDVDRNGTISREELQEAVQSLRVWLAWWKAHQGMKEADLSHSSRIDNADEFKRLSRQERSMINKMTKFSDY
ncbi:hypothetical protein EUGRSUZ_H02011 [Eucalyptus grandis]|uniref:Uncharacterized protein n=2 Tax=Eucalyptus grandis TaxID=71139 RepID=A0ACC3JQF7_EUCGR|nr:hypothetical protein EUGRSUZ_H02011 [Eucalyptus grandis]